MKKLLMLLSCLAGLSLAQSGGGYIKNDPIGQPGTKTTGCPTTPRAALPIECWVNQRIIILPMEPSLQTYGYQSISKYGKDGFEGTPYQEIAGRTATIIRIESSKSGIGKNLILKIDGLTDIYQVQVLTATEDSITFIKDLDEAKKSLLNKPLWLNDNYLHTIDANGEKSGFETKRFSKVTVTDIRLSTGITSQFTPVRVVVKDSTGKTGYTDIFWSKTNIPEPQYDSFEDHFYSNNPRTVYKWSEDIWSLIEKYQVKVGMDQDMAILSWGEPDDVNRTTSGKTISEQWVYGGRTTKARYLYFENGVLKTIQK